MIVAAPGQTFVSVFDARDSGLTSVAGVRILDGSGSTVTPRQTIGYSEVPAGSGGYVAQLAAPTTQGPYSVVWDDGTVSPGDVAADLLIVTSDLVGHGDAEPVPPNSTALVSVQGAPSGSSTISYQVVTPGGSVIRARSTLGVVEAPAGSGYYQGEFTTPSTVGPVIVVWDTGTISPGTVAYDVVYVAVPPAPIFVDEPTLPASTGSQIPPWISLCGTEVSNAARTLDYIRHLDNTGRFTVLGQLPDILYRTSGTVQTFVGPETDPAPWWDPTEPASREFLGFMAQTVGGLDGITTRAVANRGSGGASIGRGIDGPRQHEVKGNLVSLSCAGFEYGRRWLANMLQDVAGDDCALCDAAIRISAPIDDDDSRGYWELHDVGVTGDLVTEPITDGCCYVVAASFTMTAGDGWLYKPAVNCLAATVLADADSGSGCIPFDDWLCGPYTGTVRCCTLDPPVRGKTAAVVRVYAPTTVGGILVQTFGNCPPGVDDEAVSTMTIPGLPAGGELIIDSARRRVLYVAPTGAIEEGSAFVQLPEGRSLSWAEIPAGGSAHCVCVQPAHPCSRGFDTLVSVDAVHKER